MLPSHSCKACWVCGSLATLGPSLSSRWAALSRNVIFLFFFSRVVHFLTVLCAQTLAVVMENLPHTNTAELLISLVCLAVLVPVKEVNTRYRHRLRTPIPVEILTVSQPSPEKKTLPNCTSLLITYGLMLYLSGDYCYVCDVCLLTGLFLQRWDSRPHPSWVIFEVVANETAFELSRHIWLTSWLILRFPSPQPPAFHTFPAIAGDTIAITFVGYAVSVSLAMIYADKHGYSIHPNQVKSRTMAWCNVRLDSHQTVDILLWICDCRSCWLMGSPTPSLPFSLVSPALPLWPPRTSSRVLGDTHRYCAWRRFHEHSLVVLPQIFSLWAMKL